MSELVNLLQNLHKLDGVIAVSVVNSEGKEIAFSADPNAIDSSLYSRINEFIFKADGLAEALGTSAISRHHAVLKNVQVMAEALEGQYNLLVYTSGDNSNQGRIRLEIRKSKKGIEAALQTLG